MQDKTFTFNGIEFTWKKATLKYYAESKKLIKDYGKYEDEETKQPRAELMKIEGIAELLKETANVKEILERIKLPEDSEDKSKEDIVIEILYRMLQNIKDCKELFMLENLQRILEVCLEPAEGIKKINFLSTDEKYITELIEFGTEVFDFFFKRHKNSTKTLGKLLSISDDTASQTTQT